MVGGYTGKVLFADLSRGEVREESLGEKIYHDFMGCNGVGAKILFDRQKGGVDPLGPENILGFVTGPLTGTALFGTRYMAVGKSALTGTWGEGNAAGYFGTYLKSAGYDAVFFTGVSEKPVYLFINDGRAEIRDARHLWGKTTDETQDLLESELGKEVKVACIGPAGEKLSLISCIMSDRLERAIGRSGLGPVMGSKKLKAVAVIGAMKIPVANPKRIKELRRQQIDILKDADVYKKYGAIGQTALFARVGSSSVKNWSGVGTRDFPNAAAISDESVLKLEEKKEACWRCPIASGGLIKAGTEYKYKAGVHKPEYETAAAFGTNLLNDNLESIIMANDICNRYGMDVISTGMTIGFAMECYERVLITKQDTEGIELTWGNHQAIVAMTEKMCKREGFGAILADGSKVAAEKIGKGAEEYAMHVHGLEVPNADPRFAPSWAVTYVTSPMPARHMRGGAEWAEIGRYPYGVEFPKVEKYAYTGKGEIHAWLRKFYTVMDVAGLCMWGAKGLPVDAISENLAAVTGWEYSREELLKVGERVACVCQAFNVREGLKPTDFKLPPRIAGEPPLTEGPNANVTIPVESMTKEFFEAMDWDYATGKPSKEKLLELGLEEVAKELWP